MSLSRSLLFLVATAASLAHGYEGAGPRRELDAGVHLPQLTKAPAVTRFVEAAYPPAALARGEASQVTLLIDIDAIGKVTAAEVTKSGGAEFDLAAKDALLQFDFSPAELDDAPAAVRIEYVYHFASHPPETQAGLDAGVSERPAPVNLEGWVLERGTRDPIAHATVFLPESNLSAETDEQGAFALRGVPLGRVRVEISDQRHARFSTEQELREGQVTQLTAYLLKKLEGGFETTVVGDRDKKDVSVHALQKAELSTVPGTFGDPLRVLQNMPGMARAPMLSGALLVRGAQPQDSQVLVDGVPIPLLYHLGGGPSVLSPSYINTINFFPGAYGAKYGRAIAGIIDVETGAPTPTRPHGQASADFLNAGFYLESPINLTKNWGTVSVAARHSIIDLVLPPVLKALTPPGQTAIVVTPAYWDYQARYDLTLDGNAFELSAFGANDLLKISQAGTTQSQPFSVTLDEGFHRFRARWSRKTDDGWAFSLAPTFGFTSYKQSLNDTITWKANATDLNVRGWARKSLGQALTMELGVDVNGSWFHNRFEAATAATPDNPNPPPSVHDQALRLLTYAAYAEAIWTPVARWKLIPGVRFELYNLPSGLTASLEPRFATRVRLTDWATVKAAWGLYRQAPQVQELDSALGNSGLGLAMSQQVAGGLELVLMPKLSLDVQGFFNWRTSLVAPTDALIERDGVTVPSRYDNSGTGRAWGLEVLLRQDVTERLYGWVSYTLSRSENYSKTTGTWSPVSTDQTHLLTVVASYKFDFGIEAGVRFRLTTGSPYTPVQGATFNADTDSYTPLYGASNSARRAAFHQLDVRLEKQFTFETWKFSIYLDVQNVYNASNAEETLWDYRYRESAALNGLPIVPSLGLKGEF
jgi:TonB family protein